MRYRSTRRLSWCGGGVIAAIAILAPTAANAQDPCPEVQVTGPTAGTQFYTNEICNITVSASYPNGSGGLQITLLGLWQRGRIYPTGTMPTPWSNPSSPGYTHAPSTSTSGAYTFSLVNQQSGYPIEREYSGGCQDNYYATNRPWLPRYNDGINEKYNGDFGSNGSYPDFSGQDHGFPDGYAGRYIYWTFKR